MKASPAPNRSDHLGRNSVHLPVSGRTHSDGSAIAVGHDDESLRGERFVKEPRPVESCSFGAEERSGVAGRADGDVCVLKERGERARSLVRAPEESAIVLAWIAIRASRSLASPRSAWSLASGTSPSAAVIPLTTRTSTPSKASLGTSERL